MKPLKDGSQSSRKTRKAWAAMKLRCGDPGNKFYRLYGGRGIRVCDRWSDFANFLEDMGLAPDGRQIDRIDNDGNYEPGNCRWATPKENTNNRSSSIRVAINGEVIGTEEIAKLAGISRSGVSQRLRAGWPIERLLDPPYPLTGSKNSGAKNGMAKLSDTDLERITDMYVFGAKPMILSKLFLVGNGYISRLTRAWVSRRVALYQLNGRGK